MEILEEYKNYLKEKNNNISETSIKMYCNAINKYFEFAKNDYKEKKKYIYLITTREFKKYKIHLKRKGYSIQTINYEMRFFKIYENFLITTGRKNKRVIKDKLHYKPERKNIQNISEENYELIIEMAKKDNSKYYLMFILYIRCKISSRKLMNIKIKEDIDLKKKIIKVGDESIEITEEIEKAIRRYLRERKKFLEGYQNDYLFVSHIGKKYGKQMEKTSFSRAVKLYYQRLIESEDYYGDWSDCY